MKKEDMALALYNIINLAIQDRMVFGQSEKEALADTLADARMTKKDWSYIKRTISEIGTISEINS